MTSHSDTERYLMSLNEETLRQIIRFFIAAPKDDLFDVKKYITNNIDEYNRMFPANWKWGK